MFIQYDRTQIRDAIERAGLTIVAFSEFAGISRVNMVRLLNGNHNPRVETLEKIQQALAKIATGDHPATTGRAGKPAKNTYSEGTSPKGGAA